MKEIKILLAKIETLDKEEHDRLLPVIEEKMEKARNLYGDNSANTSTPLTRKLSDDICGYLTIRLVSLEEEYVRDCMNGIRTSKGN